MVFAPLAVAAAAAVVVSASPVEKPLAAISISSKVSPALKDGALPLVQSGKARLSHVNNGKVALASSGSVTNTLVSYTAPVSIGGKTYNLIVDTGSSNTWCGAQSSCEPTSTGKSTGGSVQVSYGSGSFSGREYTDNVAFAGLTVTAQSIGAATSSTGFDGVDGILGFGPVGLTQGTVSNANTVPTFTNNLKSQGKISTEVLGVSFRSPGASSSSTNGELTLGGTDSSKYTGSITYFPKLTSGQASAYWGISVSGFTYGSTSLGSGSGIVDTGTTLIYIPTSAYNKFLSSAKGTTDSNSGLARFSTKPTGNFGVKFGSTTYTLTPTQYLVPTSEYSYFGLQSGYYYAWINDGGSSGVNVIIGQKFLENYYSVFDSANSRIGFATNS